MYNKTLFDHYWIVINKHSLEVKCGAFKNRSPKLYMSEAVAKNSWYIKKFPNDFEVIKVMIREIE